MTITAYRGGGKSEKWSEQYEDIVKCEAHQLNSCISIQFIINSKGGGETKISVEIHPDSFERVAEIMTAADVRKAVKAFGSALLNAEIDK